jgi:hypothetical protein
MTYGTKMQIRHDYLNNLERIYAGRIDYSSGSRARELAIKAADAALAGDIKLEGQAWFEALASNGVQKSATKKMIEGLPS